VNESEPNLNMPSWSHNSPSFATTPSELKPSTFLSQDGSHELPDFPRFDLCPPPIAALFLLIVPQVVIAPPSVPGKISVFGCLVLLALSVYYVNTNLALGYSIALYAVAFLPKVLLGAMILTFSGWRNFLPDRKQLSQTSEKIRFRSSLFAGKTA